MQIKHTKSKTKFIAIDSLAGQPLFSVEGNEQKVNVVYHSKIESKIGKAILLNMFKSMRYLFFHRKILLNTSLKDPYEGEYTISHLYSYSKDCLFPKTLGLSYDKMGIELDIKTNEFECITNEL